MIRTLLRQVVLVAALSALTLAGAQPALAQDEAPLILPKGLGCPNFNLGLLGTGGKLHTKEFTDKNGDVVKLHTAGKGVLLTYTNYGSDPDHPVAGKSISIKTGGSVNSTQINPDGSSTVTATGHNGLILFPTDIPAGPTATQYVGRIVYTVSTGGVFTLLTTSGQATDICKVLS